MAVSSASVADGDVFIERLPARPYCTDNLAHGLKIKGKSHAVLHGYIQPNSPGTLSWLIFDVDRAGAAFVADDAYLPPPTIAVVNPENGHAHLLYAIREPVFCYGEYSHPLRFAASIQNAYTTALGADPGYSGLIAKNPVHPRWRVLWNPLAVYDLGELAEYVNLAAYKPRRDTQKTGLGRNVSLFDSLRKQAYSWSREFKSSGSRADEFFMFLLKQAESINLNQFPSPLPVSEVRAITKSIHKWVWKRFSITGFSAWQAQKGKLGGVKSGQARMAKSEDKRASARLMSVSGMSLRQIAEQLEVNHSTVARWIKNDPS